MLADINMADFERRKNWLLRIILKYISVSKKIIRYILTDTLAKLFKIFFPLVTV